MPMALSARTTPSTGTRLISDLIRVRVRVRVRVRIRVRVRVRVSVRVRVRVRVRAGLGLGLGLGLGRGGYDARVHRDAEHASVAAAARELCGEGEARQLGRAVPSVRAYGRQAARIGIHMPHV